MINGPGDDRGSPRTATATGTAEAPSAEPYPLRDPNPSRYRVRDLGWIHLLLGLLILSFTVPILLGHYPAGLDHRGDLFLATIFTGLGICYVALSVLVIRGYPKPSWPPDTMWITPVGLEFTFRDRVVGRIDYQDPELHLTMQRYHTNPQSPYRSPVVGRSFLRVSRWRRVRLPEDAARGLLADARRRGLGTESVTRTHLANIEEIVHLRAPGNEQRGGTPG